jgi:hypothetical protein
LDIEVEGGESKGFLTEKIRERSGSINYLRMGELIRSTIKLET